MGDARVRPRVCFLRGSYLNAFEAQYLVPLLEDFDLVAACGGYQRYDTSDLGVPVLQLRQLDYLNGLLPQVLAGRRVPNPLKRFGFEEVMVGLERALDGFDLVHVPEQTFYFSWQAARAGADLPFRLVTTQDEVTPFWYAAGSHVERRAAEVRARTDRFHARSERAASALRCEGVDAGRIEIIGHGVDVTRFNPGPPDADLCAELGIDPDRFTILFVGRLVWTKGIFVLADAAARLLADPGIRELDPQFLVVGDGPERAAFEARIRRLGLERQFRLVGWQAYDRLPDIHRLGDIFVLPSIPSRTIIEQFGIVLIESMASGKPVVTTACGAIDEVVGGAGVLVPPNDHLRLYQALRDLAEDPDARSRLGAAGLERVRSRFTHRLIAGRLAGLYETALSL